MMRFALLLGLVWIVAILPMMATSSSSSSSSSRDVFALSKWAKKKGIQMHNSLQWKEYSTSGGEGGEGFDEEEEEEEEEASNWGLELTESVPPGTILLQVPQTLVLDSASLRKEFEKSLGTERLQQILQKLGEFRKHEDAFLIFLQVLACSSSSSSSSRDEEGDTSSSDWSPWIQALPRKYPSMFTANERDCLPFYAKYAADYQVKKFEAFQLAVAELMIEEDNNPLHDTETPPPEKLLLWAFHAVGSRFWTTDPLSGSSTDQVSNTELVPVGDMFNHRHPPNVAITHDNGCVNFIYKGDPDENNKDLYITYGQPSNTHRFLAIFGFVPSNDMTEIWSQIAYPNNPFTVNVPSMTFGIDGSISKTVWDAVLYALLQPSETAGIPEYTKEQHIKYRKHTLVVLQRHLEKELEELATLRQKIDKTLTTTTTRSSNLDVIRQHNLFLTNVFSKVKDRLESESGFSWTTEL